MLGTEIFSFLINLLGVTWSGYVLTVVWELLIVPTFHYRFLSFPMAIGICIVFRLVTYRTDYYDGPDLEWKKVISKGIKDNVITPLGLLGIAFIVYMFA